MTTFPLSWDEFTISVHLRGTTHVQSSSAKALVLRSPALISAPLMLRLHLLTYGISRPRQKLRCWNSFCALCDRALSRWHESLLTGS